MRMLIKYRDTFSLRDEIGECPNLKADIKVIDENDKPFMDDQATTRPPRPSSTAECLRLIARLREEQASAASWEPRPPFEAAEMD